MLKERRELEENLIPILKSTSIKKRKVGIIKKELLKFEIHEGTTQKFFTKPESIREVDTRVLYLLTDILHKETQDLSIYPEDYFTEIDKKESLKYSGELETEDIISLPLAIDNATIVGNGVYMATLPIRIINKLLQQQLLSYNFDVQREAKFERRKNEVVKIATLNINSVKEISQHLLDGTLVPTVLTFNAATRTSDSGDELIYDNKKTQLTITKGTVIDIIDGYHRCKGIQLALSKNPDLDFNFPIMFTNYSIKKAQQYLGQIAKANPISKTRILELSQSRLSDSVVQQLKDESDLKGKVSQTARIHSLNKELVTYNVLSDTIDEQFKMETKADAMDVGDYLVDFFNYLIGIYPEEFISNIEETRNLSLINENSMFAGYIVLARRMFEDGKKVKELRQVLNKIDFSKDNNLWEELNILSDKKLTTNARKNIVNFFKELELQ